MITVSDIVYLVIVWSVTGPAVVSGQCTTKGCGVFHDDDYNPYTSELEDLKLHVHMVTAENGMSSYTQLNNHCP